MQDSASFWTDIKNLEEQFARVPESFCFARLAEVYLQVGLVGDALHVARQGVLTHPRYMAGQRVLSQACYASGLTVEAMTALQVVTEALPEDVASQKLLGRLLAEAGNKEGAALAFRTALEFAPDDVECRIELESLERSAGVTEDPFEADGDTDDETVIEDLEILEEPEIIDEDQSEAVPRFKPAPAEFRAHTDPLTTSTLAELYVSQGFTLKALEIYRTILTGNPDDLSIAVRIAELEKLEDASPEDIEEIDDALEDQVETEIESVDTIFSMPSEPEKLPAFKNLSTPADESRGYGFTDSYLQGNADKAISVLDGWLENVRKIKSCR